MENKFIIYALVLIIAAGIGYVLNEVFKKKTEPEDEAEDKALDEIKDPEAKEKYKELLRRFKNASTEEKDDILRTIDKGMRTGEWD